PFANTTADGAAAGSNGNLAQLLRNAGPKLNSLKPPTVQANVFGASPYSHPNATNTTPEPVAPVLKTTALSGFGLGANLTTPKLQTQDTSSGNSANRFSELL